MWVATANIPVVSGIVNISTHTTHVGGDTCGNKNLPVYRQISTHTTHVGGDFNQADNNYSVTPISTHTTHVGGDREVTKVNWLMLIFQLTPPMWVATRQNRHR